MDLMTSVGAAIACSLVILLAVVILSRRIDKVSEQLIELRLLHIKLEPTDTAQRSMRTTSAAASLRNRSTWSRPRTTSRHSLR